MTSPTIQTKGPTHTDQRSNHLHPRDFLINSFQDVGQTDVFGEVIETFDKEVFDLDNPTSVFSKVFKLLIPLAFGKPLPYKQDIVCLTFGFLLYYPGAFEWALLNEDFLQATVEKLVELRDKAIEKTLVGKDGTIILMEEAKEIARRLEEAGRGELAALL